MRPVKVLVMLARLTKPLSTVWGAAKRSMSFKSIGHSVRLRIVRSGRAMVLIDRRSVRMGCLETFHKGFEKKLCIRLELDILVSRLDSSFTVGW